MSNDRNEILQNGIMSETALIVIDMQNGFVTPECQHIVPNIVSLINDAKMKKQPILFTKFINKEESGYVRWLGWRRLMTPPETDLISELDEYNEIAHSKTQYSSFTPETTEILSKHKVKRLIICGVATDGCVLKTAVDAFERDIEPIVVSDACYSHAGETVHEAGLLLLGRFIGKRQLKTTREILKLN